jgi:hypothetical protein
VNRAVLVPFHRYQPHEGLGYRVLFDHFLKKLPLWADEFDTLYIIDSDMGFDNDDRRALQKIKPGTVILNREIDGHHWIQYKWALPKIEEENILFLDHDVVITQSGIIDSWFRALENGYDFVGSFDGSGGLREQIHAAFPFMKDNNFTRMGSYYFLLSKTFLSKIKQIDFAPVYYDSPVYLPEINYMANKGDWMDSFGLFTLQMLALNPKIKVIDDPRETIYLQPIDGTWKVVKEPESPQNLGYYHIRNGNLANYVLTSKISGHEDDYIREINGNKRELLRSLAWFYHMSDYDGDPLISLLKDMGVKYRDFLVYFAEFEKYHNLV